MPLSVEEKIASLLQDGALTVAEINATYRARYLISPPLTLSDVLTVPPMWVLVSPGSEEELAEAVASVVFAGLRGIVVPPKNVSAAKERIAQEV